MKKYLIAAIAAVAFLIASLTFQACATCGKCPKCCVGQNVPADDPGSSPFARQDISFEDKTSKMN